MANKQDLLFELGTEELPPLALTRLAEALRELFGQQLAQQRLAHGAMESFATPRRLALRVRDLDTAQPDQILPRRGPALGAAYDAQGHPMPAALGFARSVGVPVDRLEREETDKGTWLCYRQSVPGRPTAQLLGPMLEAALAGLPIPKRMRWSDLDAEFVRPVHRVVLLLGGDVVPAEILGIQTGRLTRGHRFHHPEDLALAHPAEYETRLETAKVVVDFPTRRARIQAAVEALAAESGAQAILEPGLLDEVTALVEWPVALLGGFDPAFLKVPKEVLMATMQKNQKYFPLLDAQGKLLPRFIAISNLESRDPDQVRAGNERVIRPRFKDAAFFWEQDLKCPLEALAPRLATVVFQERLGTLQDKSERLERIVARIADRLGFDQDLGRRAARLSKCALLTNMVSEFPNLQGVMGRYYAQAHGEAANLAAAMEEQYLPRFAGDGLPVTAPGQALAIADRVDSLVGIFAIGQRPSGVKDPYGLRRAALGVLRILIETPLELDLKDLLATTADALADKLDARPVLDEVFGYMMERLQGYYAEQGISGDVVDAVLAKGLGNPSDLHRRIQAVAGFRRLPEAQSLSAAHKRIRNLLRRSEEGLGPGLEIREDLMETASERTLLHEIQRLRQAIAPSLADGRYAVALERLAEMREPVDRFFDEVMVNCEDPALRANRLALLRVLEGMLIEVADISRLQSA